MKPPSSLVSAKRSTSSAPRTTPNASKSARVVGSGLKVLVSCQSWPMAIRMEKVLSFQKPDGVVEPVQGFIDVGQGHRGTEAMMTGRPAVIVEVDAVVDGRLDEAQHQ